MSNLTAPTLAELIAEAKATPGRLHGYCPAHTRALNCNRPLNHPRDFHAEIAAPALGAAVELRAVWPVNP